MMALDKTFSSGEVLSAGDVNGHLLSMWIPIDKRVIASGAPVSSVSFASLDSNFRQFRLTFDVRTTASIASLRFNNDSAANYGFAQMWAQSATPQSGQSTGTTSIAVGFNSGVGSLGHYIIGKPVAALAAHVVGGTSYMEGVFITHGSLSGTWGNTTTLINRIDLLVTSGTFYGVVALEGMRGV